MNNKYLKGVVTFLLITTFGLVGFTQSTIITVNVPPYPGDATKYLNGNQQWTVPAGGGGGGTTNNWVNSGTTNSTLAGVASANGLNATNSITLDADSISKWHWTTNYMDPVLADYFGITTIRPDSVYNPDSTLVVSVPQGLIFESPQFESPDNGGEPWLWGTNTYGIILPGSNDPTDAAKGGLVMYGLTTAEQSEKAGPITLVGINVTSARYDQWPLICALGHPGVAIQEVGTMLFSVNMDGSPLHVLSVNAQHAYLPAGYGRAGINTNIPTATLEVTAWEPTIPLQKWSHSNDVVVAQLDFDGSLQLSGVASANGVVAANAVMFGPAGGWFSYTATDSEGGTLYGVASTNSFLTNVLDFAANNLPLLAGDFGPVFSLGALMDVKEVAKSNTDVFSIGQFAGQTQVLDGAITVYNIMQYAGYGQSITNEGTEVLNLGYDTGDAQVVNASTSIYNIASTAGSGQYLTNAGLVFNFGSGAGNHQIIDSSTQIYNYGDASGQSQTVTNSHFIHNFGQESGFSMVVNNSTDIHNSGTRGGYQMNVTDSDNIYAMAGGLNAATLTSSKRVMAIGPGAGDGITGSYTNVLFIGAGATVGATSKDRVILGTAMILTAPGGAGSLGVSTITTSATGATNTINANVLLYVTAATGAALTDNAGTTEFSGVTIAAFTPIRLQPGGKFTGTAITYATGTASHAW